MKNLIFGISIVFLMFVVATGFNENPALRKASLGERVSGFDIENSSSSLSVGGRQDKYTVLVFWNSQDASSRWACTHYSKILQANKNIAAKVKFAAINLDSSVALYDEMIKNDRLDEKDNFHAEGDLAMRLRTMFDLDKGMGTVLIAPDGTVAGFNPTELQLLSLGA